jgi:hypothetical protein
LFRQGVQLRHRLIQPATTGKIARRIERWRRRIVSCRVLRSPHRRRAGHNAKKEDENARSQHVSSTHRSLLCAIDPSPLDPDPCLAQKKRGAVGSPQGLLRFLSLELQAQGELQLTRSAIGAGTASAAFAADCAGGFNVAARVTRGDVVEDVEGVHTELGRNTLPNRE